VAQQVHARHDLYGEEEPPAIIEELAEAHDVRVCEVGQGSKLMLESGEGAVDALSATTAPRTRSRASKTGLLHREPR
jgi:hypothetical protein